MWDLGSTKAGKGHPHTNSFTRTTKKLASRLGLVQGVGLSKCRGNITNIEISMMR